MPRFDLLVRGGQVVSGPTAHIGDIAISDGQIVELAPEIEGTTHHTIDATGLTVLPGGIDPHVHFNEPGRSDWEGWDTGSQALVAGGITTCLEMPLNAHPPTLDRISLDMKVAAASGTSFADFALWGGLTPHNLDHLADLADAGVVGFKAFMSDSGMNDFEHAGDDTLFHGMQIAAKLGLPVAVHAENDAITRDLATQARQAGRTAMRDYLESRPVVAEVEAIGRAIALAEDTGCSLHIVHVSTGRGVALVSEARLRGVDVTCETCPHYLVFTDDDAERIGALAKCAPPFRDALTRQSLWDSLLAGEIDMLASDHSPAPVAMKQSSNAFDNWGGISGCQHLLPVMLSVGGECGLDIPDMAKLISSNVARRFRLPGKGEIAPDSHADLCIVAPQTAQPIALDTIRYRHRSSAWDGCPVTWSVRTTIVRGHIVVHEGRLCDASPAGRLIRPDPLAGPHR